MNWQTIYNNIVEFFQSFNLNQQQQVELRPVRIQVEQENRRTPR